MLQVVKSSPQMDDELADQTRKRCWRKTQERVKPKLWPDHLDAKAAEGPTNFVELEGERKMMDKFLLSGLVGTTGSIVGSSDRPVCARYTQGSNLGYCWPGGVRNASSVKHHRRRCRTKTRGMTGRRSTKTLKLTLRGLNIQYPFSRLLMLGAKTVEARSYRLGHRNIVNAGEDMFLIETPGPKHVRGAVVNDLAVGEPPIHAQVVGTIAFSSSKPYIKLSEWTNDRHRHCIKEAGKHDWNGVGLRYGWRVEKVQSFAKPVAAGSKTQTGYGRPRALNVLIV